MQLEVLSGRRIAAHSPTPPGEIPPMLLTFHARVSERKTCGDDMSRQLSDLRGEFPTPETSNTDNASSVQTESNEILLGHIFKLTDEDGDLMESQLSDG